VNQLFRLVTATFGHKMMKNKATIILITFSFAFGCIAGFFCTGFFMKRYIARFETLNTTNEIIHLHNALQSADSGNIAETQEKLEASLRSALFMLDVESDFHGCKSAEESVQKAEQYLNNRNETTEPSVAH
jgi:hypothetical protein